MRISGRTRRAEATWAALLGAAAFVASAALPRGGLADAERFGDVHHYRRFADLVLAGELPYRDFFVEYPPGALPVFVAPALAGDRYDLAFKLAMALCGAAAVALLALLLGRLGASSRRLWSAVAAVALVPAVFGPVALNTYDLWPALLVVGALWALIAGRVGWAFALLGVATTAKLVPALLLPLFVVHVWRSAPHAVRRGLASFVAAGAVVSVPFAVLAPGGLGFSIWSQATRGLHADSLGASMLLAADRLGVYDARTELRPPGALEVVGPAAAATAIAASALVVAAAAVVLWLYARREPAAQPLATAAAATIMVPLALGKVLSPQFLTWSAPLVPLVPGVLGFVAVALLWAALGTTIVFFLRYVTPFDLDAGVWLLLGRNLVLVTLLIVVVAALVRTPARAAGARS